MSKKQNKLSSSHSDLVFFILLFVIIIGCFVLLVPKVASDLFPWKRGMILNNFLQSVSKSQTINSQTFWEFREFYSPGYYTFNRSGLAESQIQTAENKIGILLNMKYINRIFLTFTSPHLNSLEALTTTNDLSNIINILMLDKTQSILSNDNEIIYKDSSGNMHIIFLKSEQQMETANGYFNYTDTDKSIVAGKYWLDVTSLDGK